MTGFDYKEQIHFKAWFACHRLCFISFLYSSQLDSVIQRSRIYLCLHFWIGFQLFFRPPLIRVNTYLHEILETKKGRALCKARSGQLDTVIYGRVSLEGVCTGSGGSGWVTRGCDRDRQSRGWRPLLGLSVPVTPRANRALRGG